MLQQKLMKKVLPFLLQAFLLFIFLVGHQDGGAWNSCPLRRGWGSWPCIAWSRHRFGENLTAATSACVEVIKDIELGTLERFRVAGQGTMSINWKKEGSPLYKKFCPQEDSQAKAQVITSCPWRFSSLNGWSTEESNLTAEQTLMWVGG